MKPARTTLMCCIGILTAQQHAVISRSHRDSHLLVLYCSLYMMAGPKPTNYSTGHHKTKLSVTLRYALYSTWLGRPPDLFLNDKFTHYHPIMLKFGTIAYIRCQFILLNLVGRHDKDPPLLIFRTQISYFDVVTNERFQKVEFRFVSNTPSNNIRDRHFNVAFFYPLESACYKLTMYVRSSFCILRYSSADVPIDTCI